MLLASPVAEDHYFALCVARSLCFNGIDGCETNLRAVSGYATLVVGRTA